MSASIIDKPAETPSYPNLHGDGGVAPSADGHKRWTRDDCRFLENLGLVKGRYELLDGEIYPKSYQPEYGFLLPADEGRKRWTIAECEYLELVGLLKDNYELLDGEIIVKAGQNGPHSISTMRLIAYCLSLFPAGDRVRTQTTVIAKNGDQYTNRPEPDVVILRDAIGTRAPLGNEIQLAIEVCDTTQDRDFNLKSALYARAGVAEYWILDLVNRRLVVFRFPEGDEWRGRDEYGEGQSVAPLCAPEFPVAIADLLP